MKFLLFSVYDLKGGVYMVPFPARSTVDAVRSVTASFSDPEVRATPAYTNAGDFALYEIGNFDDETGLIESVYPVFVVRLADLKNPPASTVPS